MANSTPNKIGINPVSSLLSVSANALKPVAYGTVNVLSTMGEVASKTVPGLPGTALSWLGGGKDITEALIAGKSAGIPGAVVRFGYDSVSSALVTQGMKLGASSALRAAASEGLAVTAPAITGTAIVYGGAVAVTGLASYKFSEYFIAPVVAPTIGGWMYNAAPGLFTPH